jgi:hypothetical protein
MKFFNPDKLTTGKEAVEAVFEASDFLGLEIIRVVGIKPGAHVSGIGGFEVPKVTINRTGIGSTHVMTHGTVYLYPDGNMQKHGFVLATEKNKRALTSHLAANVINILSKDDLEEIQALAISMGKTVERAGYTPSNVPSSKHTETNKLKLEAKSKKLEDTEKALEEQKAETARLQALLEDSQIKQKLQESVVKNSTEEVVKSEEALEVSQTNDTIKATLPEHVEKSLGEDGEVITTVKKTKKPGQAQRKISRRK